MRRQVDYAVCYLALGLPPGAPLSDIEDEGRFLRAAWHPDKFQGRLKEQATERMKSVNVAVDELRAYWKNHGAAPPGLGPTARPEPKPEAPRPEPRPEPKPEPKAQPRPNTDKGNAPGVNTAYDHANHLAVIGGYRGRGLSSSGTKTPIHGGCRLPDPFPDIRPSARNRDYSCNARAFQNGALCDFCPPPCLG